MSEIRDYVLIIEDGFWHKGDVVRRYKRVRAYTAEDAKVQFGPVSFERRDGVMEPRQRLLTVVPYEPELHGELAPEDHVT